MPASCSRKKHTALPRSAHEPPPNDTTTSMASRRAWSTACCTSGSRHVRLDLGERGGERSAEQPATTPLPSADASRPAGGDEQRLAGADGLRSSRRQPLDGAGAEHELLGERGVGPAPITGTQRSARRSSSRWLAGLDAVADEPLVPKAAANASSGIARKKTSRGSGWRAPPSTPASRRRSRCTSTHGGDDRLGAPERATPRRRRGPRRRARSRRLPRPPRIIRRRWSRFMVASKTRGVPASSAARTPTRCTWMWSGWP